MKSSKLAEYNEIVGMFSTSQEFTQWLITIAPYLTPEQSQRMRKKENFLPGCQNPVWISGMFQENVWEWSIDSNSKVTLGVGKILQDVYNGKTTHQAQEIIYHDFKEIARAMPVIRQRGLQMMINRIHTIANNKE